jgi:putative ABC transport system permease protein
VTADFKSYDLPPEGLALSTELAKILGVRPGDALTIEVLEGRRPVRQARLAATVDDLIGLSAYMEVNALNRLLQEGQTISGAFLMVDSREQQDLYSLLKEAPAVAGVNVPAAALGSFRDSVGRTIGTMTGFLIFFACVIAFGIIYNAARIALSERGRDLASLRVLGFTQQEIRTMLLGEQALLTLIAIPLGLLIGYGLSALIVTAIDTEMVRLPLTATARTYIWASLVIAIAAVLSGLLVAWRMGRLDLIEVLKTRE